MLNMENAEEVMQILERFTRLKQKEIPKELDDYMHYVAKTGDTVFKWSSLKYLFREKLLNVIKNFYDTSPRVDDLPQYPNVDPFNYESMKSSLLERLELFNAAPFTVQRLCELLTEPRKQYSRIDKFMRALEKNILVVSTIEPGRKQTESENGDSLDSVVNGDVSLDVNVDIEMENETNFNAADAPNNATQTPSEIAPAQPSSNLIHKADDDILPNPKKAKLDLGENNDVETEAATKSITSSNPEPTIPTAEETTDATEKKAKEDAASQDKPAAAENAVESMKEDKKVTEADAEPEKMEEDLPDSTAITDTKPEAEKPNAEESVKKSEDNKEVTSTPASTVELQESEQSKTAEETVDSSTDIEAKKIDKEPTDKKEESSEEQVIKKTKEAIEKPNTNEKEVQNGDDKPSELKTENNITTTVKTNDKQSELAAEEENKVSTSDKKTEGDNSKQENGDNAEASQDEGKKAETDIAPKAAAAEAKQETKTDDVKMEDEAMAVSDDKSKTTKEEKTPIVDDSTVKEVDTAIKATESPSKETVSKEDEVQSTEVKEKETDKPKVADASAVEAASEEAAAVVKQATEKEVEAATAESTPAAEKAEVEAIVEKPAIEKTDGEKRVENEKPEVEMAEAATPTIADTPAVTPPADESPATGASADTNTEVAAPTTAIPTPKAASIDIPAVQDEPAISADQPMEENPDSIAEAEPVVPAIVETAATVDEVVMGDSAEMATDAIEPSKDEPAGMEVDDTSQEAMDQ